MSYQRDVEELSIHAALNGGEVFQYVGSAGDTSCSSFKYLVENLEAAVLAYAKRAGYGGAPRVLRWGAERGSMVYCVGYWE